MGILTVTVSGSSAITRRPERGVLNLTVNAKGSTREIVSHKVLETTNELNQLFKELSPKTESGDPTADAAVVTYSSTSLRTWSWNIQNEGSVFKVQEYRGNLSFVAVFRDFTKMSEVAGKLVAYSDVDINSIDWELTAATKKALSSESRKEAIRDAVQKANDYTEVIGRKVAAVDIRDGGNSSFGVLTRTAPNPFAGGGGGLFGSGPSFGKASGGASGSGLFGGAANNAPAPPPTHPTAPFDLTPQEIQYTSSVQVRFESDPNE
ncbi:hypothetical protein PCG10_000246 [Penicillium crustosum]|uniref:DUF541 domain-containing protein n=1 Tax=Penicillium crustosum TaxID=36656 RepID=A0A9P5GRN2_PENCR|nr:uncharacterized protein N7487_007841 [Penicillium crustosum]KAF7530736.1 hypothetical protein PCG10_000246 [Penicillium crustosum]KAJ5401945.1 hypothetical protein N7487_007841 [Penicillium crustosum]